MAEGPVVAQPATPTNDPAASTVSPRRIHVIATRASRNEGCVEADPRIRRALSGDQDCLCQSVWNEPGRSTRS